MTEEYSDGIDSDYSYLKYEKTQNRDIIRTIERINRSEKFKGSANDIVNAISPILKGESAEILKDVWRDIHESHTDPNGLSLNVDIVPPVFKKIHPEGDNDGYFKMHKEYPFYYLFNLKVSARFVPSDNDKMKEDEVWYGKWFVDNVYPKFSKILLERVRTELGKKFNNVFSFPILEKIEDEASKNENGETANDSDKSKETIEDSLKRTENRINVITSSVLKFNKNGESSGINSMFDSSDEMKDILISSIAMALERIIHV